MAWTSVGTGTTGNIVRGNFIGTNAAGTGAIANGDDGVFISDGASGNIIGGTVAGSRNVISGNANGGVQIRGTGTDGNIVQGNYLGTDKTGTAPLGNFFGVAVAEGASNNSIGGATPAARNIISSNTGSTGVTIGGGSGNKVRGNYIGTDKSGGIALGNDGHGVIVSVGATGTRDRWYDPGHRQRHFREYVFGRCPHRRGHDRQSDPGESHRCGRVQQRGAGKCKLRSAMRLSESGNFVGGTEPVRETSSRTTA